MKVNSETEYLRRWYRFNRPEPTVDEIRALLEERYRAYEIPLCSITATDYANDEEVREDDIFALYTITHPDVLNEIHDAESRRLQASEPDDIEEDWRGLFSSADEETPLAYILLLVQHRLGQRTSVVLERQGDTVTNFKVYGHSQPLIDHLTEVIGVPNRTPNDREEFGIDPGNFNDPNFRWYLGFLEERGLLPDRED